MEIIRKSKGRDLRSAYDNALYASTAIQNLLQRKASPVDWVNLSKEMEYISVGVRTFLPHHAKWIHNNGRERPELVNVVKAQKWYLRSDFDENLNLRVPNISLRPLLLERGEQVLTSVNLGMYQIN